MTQTSKASSPKKPITSSGTGKAEQVMVMSSHTTSSQKYDATKLSNCGYGTRRPMSSTRRKADLITTTQSVVPAPQGNMTTRDIPDPAIDDISFGQVHVSKSGTMNQPSTFKSSTISSRKSPIPLGYGSRMATPELLRSAAGSRASKRADDHGGYDDDFEDYDDDFEQFDDDHSHSSRYTKPGSVVLSTEISDVKKALEEENNRIMNERFKSPSPERTIIDSSPTRLSATTRSGSPTRNETFTTALPERKVVDLDYSLQKFQSKTDSSKVTKAAVKARKRADDLRDLIDLDFAIYDNMFDLSPLNEYELFMRNLAVSGVMHEASQTKEDMLFSRESQTEDWWIEDKWTSAPAIETDDCGSVPTSLPWLSDEYTPEKEWSNMAERMKNLMRNIDSIRLARFLKKSSHVLDILLEESVGDAQSLNIYSGKPQTPVSRGYSSIQIGSSIKGAIVNNVSFCPTDVRTVLVSWSEIPNQLHPSLVTCRGLIGVFRMSDPSKPHRLLICDAEITSCCFSPTASHFIIAGTKDGSIQLWDTREDDDSSGQKLLSISWTDDESIKVPLQFPSYSTDGSANLIHQDAIVQVQFLHSKRHNGPTTSSNNALTVFSIDALGTFQIWSLLEYENLLQAEAEADTGMSPRSLVKLIPSHKKTLKNPSRNSFQKDLQVTFALFLRRSVDKFLVGTEMGFVHMASKFGDQCHPNMFWPFEPPSTGLPVKLAVTCLSFNEHIPSLFLASFENGEIALFSNKKSQAAMVWQPTTVPIVQVLWSTHRSCVFYALDSNGTVFIYDLVNNLYGQPLIVKQEDWDGVKTNNHIPSRLCLSTNSTGSLHNQGVSGDLASGSLVLGYRDGHISIHLLEQELCEPQIDEEETFMAVIERFIS